MTKLMQDVPVAGLGIAIGRRWLRVAQDRCSPDQPVADGSEFYSSGGTTRSDGGHSGSAQLKLSRLGGKKRVAIGKDDHVLGSVPLTPLTCKDLVYVRLTLKLGVEHIGPVLDLQLSERRLCRAV